MKHSPAVSVVVPTLNGASRLPKLLDALCRQTYPAAEIIAVLDGSTDDSVNVLARYADRLPIVTLRQENRGRAGARNAGAERARGDVLVFYDDDVAPREDGIQRHVEILLGFGAVITVGQQMEPEGASHEFGRYKAFISRHWVSHLGDEPRALDEKELFLTAANMAISRHLFHRLGGFDAALRDAEDFDLAVRATDANVPVVFDPGNVVHHRSFDSFVDYIHRQRQYREAHRDLIRLRRDHPRLDLFSKYHVRKTAAKQFAYFWVPGAMAKWMDRGLFAAWPTRLKYAIYMRVIAALSVYYPDREL